MGLRVRGDEGLQSYMTPEVVAFMASAGEGFQACFPNFSVVHRASIQLLHLAIVSQQQSPKMCARRVPGEARVAWCVHSDQLPGRIRTS